MNLYKFTSILVSLTLIFYILFLGKSFFIPLSIAIVAWYLIIALSSWYHSLKFKNFEISHYLATFFSIATLVILFSLFMVLVNSSVGKVIELAPGYQEEFQNLSQDITNLIGLDEAAGLEKAFKSIDMSKILLSITSMFANIASLTTMISIFTLFLLIEYQIIGEKLKLAFNSREKYKRFCSSIADIDKDIQTYIKIKTISSLATAVLGFAVLYFVGVDLAVFWALLFFLLNFIPTIGSMVAVFFPLVITLIQFDSIIPFIIVASLLILIQTIIGSILEPKYLGKSLNLSPLVIILSLTIWGSIWGVVGMFLCVPIMVITNIILAKFEKTRPIAVMLSATGVVK